MIKKEDICKRLKEFRIKKFGPRGQKRFADFLGLNQSTYHNYEVNRFDIEFLNTLIGKTEIDPELLIFGKKEKPKDINIKIEVTDKWKKIIEELEGKIEERYVPIPIAKDPISAGSPVEVRADPDGVAIIYRHWAKNPENFTVVKVKGDSMKPTILNESLVGIDHSKKDLRELIGKIVALKDKTDQNKATIKRLKFKKPNIFVGLPDNSEEFDKTVILIGEEADEAIIGQVVWSWNLLEKEFLNK